MLMMVRRHYLQRDPYLAKLVPLAASIVFVSAAARGPHPNPVRAWALRLNGTCHMLMLLLPSDVAWQPLPS
jgi:hypothetical protein